VLKVFKI